MHTWYTQSHTTITKKTFQRFGADLNEVRNFIGGVQTRQFPPVAMLLKVISIDVTNVQNVLHKF